MPLKRALMYAGIVSLPLALTACAGNDGPQSSVGPGPQGSEIYERQPGGSQVPGTTNREFGYPNY